MLFSIHSHFFFPPLVHKAIYSLLVEVKEWSSLYINIYIHKLVSVSIEEEIVIHFRCNIM